MRFNLFPADIRVGDIEYRGARVIEHEGRVHVFVTDPDSGDPTLVASAPLAEELNGATGIVPRHIRTAGGDWPLQRSANCHCRDPLKRTGPGTLVAALGKAGR